MIHTEDYQVSQEMTNKRNTLNFAFTPLEATKICVHDFDYSPSFILTRNMHNRSLTITKNPEYKSNV